MVIPCYNAESTITDTINSILRQSYDNFRLIVVDDGSTDASAERVRAFGDRVIFETGPNRGGCHARNLGMRIGKADGATYVLFVDADDHLEGEMLSGVAEVAAKTDAEIVLSNNHIQAPDRRKERVFYSGQVDPKTFLEGWVDGRHFAPVSVTLKIDFVERLGGWDESLSRAQDTDLFLRAMFEHPKIMMNAQGAGVWTVLNPNSVSHNFSAKAMDCMIRVQANILRRMQGTDFEPVMTKHFEKLYVMSREAFRLKHVEQGREGVKAMRQMGFKRHLGNRGHKMVCSLIGLENKVRFWGS